MLSLLRLQGPRRRAISTTRLRRSQKIPPEGASEMIGKRGIAQDYERLWSFYWITEASAIEGV
jgi:hypothetical protein